jgi:hypothetical protein
MKLAPYRVHQMIQDLMCDAQGAAAFARDPEPAFERYGLSADERKLLREGSRSALIELGVHPNLQMKFARIRRGATIEEASPLDEQLRRLIEAK